MQTEIKKVVIVGGGAAGWLSALTLLKLKREVWPTLDLCIVDSSRLSPIGVGEATTTTTNEMLPWLGIDENNWLKACDGTFKFGIEFCDWYLKKESYWHLFEKPQSLESVPICYRWLLADEKKEAKQMAWDCFLSPYLAGANCAPRMINEASFTGVVNYGYHINVAKHVAYLKQCCVGNLEWIDDIVVSATQNYLGNIESIVTESGLQVFGDLFLDCTGFRALLIKQFLQEPFEEFKHELLCDSALAVALPPRKESEPIRPYTGATAMNAGWCWNIPLRYHDSIGYVHAKDHISKDEALKELAAFLNIDLNQMDVRNLDMRVGQSRRAWVKNCIAVGLAGGFIEPLESTGNSFVEVVAVKILEILQANKNQVIAQKSINEFNQYVRNMYDEVKDFIVLHYYLTQREDTSFWKAIRHETFIPETFLKKLEHLGKGISRVDLEDEGLPWFDDFFPQFSYFCVLAGMNYLPHIKVKDPVHFPLQKLEKGISQIKMNAEKLIKILPSQKEFLQKI